jgi:ligand-binding SRPBCC domain-containing protein
MPKFKYSSSINAPPETVWSFHERPDILQLLTPPWQPVKIIRREGGLDVGAVSEFRILLGPIPVKWVATHIECDRYRLFVDEQTEGPMASWIHRHEFAGENGMTRLTDAIEFALPGGIIVDILLGWWVKLRLADMFRYRHEVTKRECEKDANDG